MTEYRYITYETVDDGTIARITLNRPRTRNAQNRGLLVELNTAFLAAEADDQVRVVILGGAGPAFSSGHDLGSKESIAEREVGGPDEHETIKGWGGTRLGTEKRWTQEWHFFFQNTLRWRNLRKITIAEVKGPVYAAGLMLMWACDLIVAAEDTVFADVVGTRLGMCGVEYFAHPWEFGPRRTKEMMLTGRLARRRRGLPARDGQQGVPHGRARRSHPRLRPANRQDEHGRGPDDQGVGQSDRRQHGFLQRTERVLHNSPDESLPLGRDQRRQTGLGLAATRRSALERSARDRAAQQDGRRSVCGGQLVRLS
jgi:enoyl-CoA hydratase/carnithine racemase